MRAVAAPFRADGLAVRLEGSDAALCGDASEALRAVLENLLENIASTAVPARAAAWSGAAIGRRLAGIEVSADWQAASRRGTPDGSSTASSPRRGTGGVQGWAGIVRGHLDSAGGTIELARTEAGVAFVIRLPSAGASTPP